MSDFKEGDLLQHRVSRERCVVVSIISEFNVEVATKISEKYQICSIFDLTKVKEESSE